MLQKFLEAVLVPFIRTLLHIYFRQIEVEGDDKAPLAGPIIYTPNHINSLVDGMLARCFLPGDPRPLAKATLWDITLVKPLLVAVRAIPVYRQQDAGDERYTEANRDMFSACHEALAQGDSIVLFPEGQSHSEPELLPLKTGAARIALGAEQHRGPLGVRIVPVGLNFDVKDRFRSRVLITLGNPIDPMEGIERADSEDREAVEEVTRQIEEGIKSVTLNYPSWDEARVIRRAADLYASQKLPEEGEANIAEEYEAHKQLADAYMALKDSHHRRVERIVRSVRAYDRLLRVLSIRHEHVIQEHPKLLQTLYSLRKLSLFVVRLPLALLGLFLNAVPYYLTRLVSRIKVRPDRATTTKLVSGLFIFPLCWSLQASLLGTGLLPAWAWWVLAPLSGVSTLLFRERHTQLLEELRTYLKLNTHAEMKEELEERLEDITTEVAEFIELHAVLAKADTLNSSE